MAYDFLLVFFLKCCDHLETVLYNASFGLWGVYPRDCTDSSKLKVMPALDGTKHNR